MNRYQAKAYLHLITPFADGKIIQRCIPNTTRWDDLGDCIVFLDFPPDCYRVKPEPRTVWVNEYRSRVSGTIDYGGAYATENEARTNNDKASGYIRTVEFVEVIKGD